MRRPRHRGPARRPPRAAPVESGPPRPVSGYLEVLERGGGFLRDPARSFAPTREDVFVSPGSIAQFQLISGAAVTGHAVNGAQGPRLESIVAVCGMPPEDFRKRVSSTSMTATNPDRRFNLGARGNVSMRIIDLFAPIGRGTRGLIVSPPKAGKTTLLEELAGAILAEAPGTIVTVLLIDERPEEVTQFRRSVAAEVLASSSDESVEDHVRLATMCMAKARCELMCGRDVVVLVDSLTRMGRAFNVHGSDSGRTMSGGLDSRALEIPRKFFGMARNVEEGGSITVLATALVETGSRMDDLIFEEFKGTGNCEVVLDRSLSDQRVFPAINIAKSGTRRDELLYSAEELQAINRLRRKALELPPKQAVLELRKAMEQWPTNEELLKQITPA